MIAKFDPGMLIGLYICLCVGMPCIIRWHRPTLIWDMVPEAKQRRLILLKKLTIAAWVIAVVVGIAITIRLAYHYGLLAGN